MRRHTLQDATGVLATDDRGDILMACGTTVPSAATAGYAAGCLFWDLDASAGSILWRNEGSRTSCSFVRMGQHAGSAVGLGYVTGAGGAVTQASSASTGVTLSKPCGQITTVALTTAAAAEEVFTVTNTLVEATDVIAVATTYAGAGTPLVGVKKVVSGAFDITITNLHASAALDAAVVINFALIKAVAA